MGNKLHEIHLKIGLWTSSLWLSRKDQVLLTSNRISRSHLTHSFLLNHEPVPECVFCGCPFTIPDFLLECGDCDSNILISRLCWGWFLNVYAQTILGFFKESGKAQLLCLCTFWFFILRSLPLSRFSLPPSLPPVWVQFRFLQGTMHPQFLFQKLHTHIGIT